MQRAIGTEQQEGKVQYSSDTFSFSLRLASAVSFNLNVSNRYLMVALAEAANIAAEVTSSDIPRTAQSRC